MTLGIKWSYEIKTKVVAGCITDYDESSAGSLVMKEEIISHWQTDIGWIQDLEVLVMSMHFVLRTVLIR